MNGPEAVGLRLEHILHREKGKGGQRYLVKAVRFNDFFGNWIWAILDDYMQHSPHSDARCVPVHGPN